MTLFQLHKMSFSPLAHGAKKRITLSLCAAVPKTL